MLLLPAPLTPARTCRRGDRVLIAPAAVARAAALAALACGLDRGPAELCRSGVERRLHALSRLGRLHTVEKRIEFRAEVVQVLILPLHQRLELLVRNQHGLG